MNHDFYERYLASDLPSEFDDEDHLVWIDWRETEDAIVEYIAAKLDGWKLSATIDDAASKCGYEVSISCGDRTLTIDPSGELDCRHATLLAIDNLISPAYQIRFASATNGGDTIGVAVERIADWQFLWSKYGRVVNERFCPIRELPDLMNTPGNEIDNACRAYAERVGES